MAHGGSHCAHCNVEIQDRSTMVSRGDKQFCCNNCAMADNHGGGSMQGGANTGMSRQQR